MTKVSEYQKALIDWIKSWAPELRSVEAHAGSVSFDDVGKWLRVAPAARVAILGIGQDNQIQTGGAEHRLDVSFYFLTTTHGKLKGPDAAAALAEACVTRLQGERFKLDFVGEPERITAANLYSGSASGREGIALWSVTFQQPIQLIKSPFEDGGLRPDLYVSQAPKIGVPHVDDYELVGEGDPKKRRANG